VLAPHSPLRSAVPALARAATTSPPAPKRQPTAEPAHGRAARYAWAALVARIYEVFPLVCPLCSAEMRVIVFITDPPTIHYIPRLFDRSAMDVQKSLFRGAIQSAIADAGT
jgi:hypothetical protein